MKIKGPKRILIKSHMRFRQTKVTNLGWAFAFC